MDSPPHAVAHKPWKTIWRGVLPSVIFIGRPFTAVRTRSAIADSPWYGQTVLSISGPPVIPVVILTRCAGRRSRSYSVRSNPRFTPRSLCHFSRSRSAPGSTHPPPPHTTPQPPTPPQPPTTRAHNPPPPPPHPPTAQPTSPTPHHTPPPPPPNPKSLFLVLKRS